VAHYQTKQPFLICEVDTMMINTRVLSSATYKLKLPNDISSHALYFTLAGHPVEWIFLNSKEMESFQWIIALMESYSLLLKNDVPLAGIANMMKEVFSPNRYIIPDGTNREARSLVHHLGLIVDKHIDKFPQTGEAIC